MQARAAVASPFEMLCHASFSRSVTWHTHTRIHVHIPICPYAENTNTPCTHAHTPRARCHDVIVDTSTRMNEGGGSWQGDRVHKTQIDITFDVLHLPHTCYTRTDCTDHARTHSRVQTNAVVKTRSSDATSYFAFLWTATAFFFSSRPSSNFTVSNAGSM